MPFVKLNEAGDEVVSYFAKPQEHVSGLSELPHDHRLVAAHLNMTSKSQLVALARRIARHKSDPRNADVLKSIITEIEAGGITTPDEIASSPWIANYWEA
jgi:hypothetical protein